MGVIKKVKTIPATRTPFTSAPIAEQKKRKVAGYARVSTDHDDQFTSYEAIIDPDTFEMVQRKLARRTPGRNRHSKP